MCVVSMMGDIGGGMWPHPHPNPWKTPSPMQPWGPLPPYPPSQPARDPLYPFPPVPQQQAVQTVIPPQQFPTREQFEAFDALLRAAMKFDEATGQKECETAAKTAWIKSFYDHFGMKSPL
jgi:hypothetical protein